MKCLEVVVSNVNRDRLYISRKRLGMLDHKFKQQSALIGAEFEVGLLNQVVHYLLRSVAPLICNANDRKTNRSVKTGDELIPSFAVICLGAGADQLFTGHRRMAGQNHLNLEWIRILHESNGDSRILGDRAAASNQLHRPESKRIFLSILVRRRRAR